jgi:hypothetical protein
MAIQMSEGFQLYSKGTIDNRILYKNLSEMVAMDDSYLYDGILATIEEDTDKKTYQWWSGNAVDETLGKWRELSSYNHNFLPLLNGGRIVNSESDTTSKFIDIQSLKSDSGVLLITNKGIEGYDSYSDTISKYVLTNDDSNNNAGLFFYNTPTTPSNGHITFQTYKTSTTFKIKTNTFITSDQINIFDTNTDASKLTNTYATCVLKPGCLELGRLNSAASTPSYLHILMGWSDYGKTPTASGMCSVSIGNSTASGNYSCARGTAVTASGRGSTAIGYNSYTGDYYFPTTASGDNSTAIGPGLTAASVSQIVVGCFNKNKNTTLFEVGTGYQTGVSTATMQNGFEVYRKSTLHGADGYLDGCLDNSYSSENKAPYQYIVDNIATIFNDIGTLVISTGNSNTEYSSTGENIAGYAAMNLKHFKFVYTMYATRYVIYAERTAYSLRTPYALSWMFRYVGYGGTEEYRVIVSLNNLSNSSSDSISISSAYYSKITYLTSGTTVSGLTAITVSSS